MEKKFKVGDRVIFNGSLKFRDGKHAIEIEIGDGGTVCEPQFPLSEWVVSVMLDDGPDRPVTVPTDIVEPDDEDEPETEEETAPCEDITIPPGFILFHTDATGEPVMYRGALIDAFGDGYLLLKDGTEVDCEEGIEYIARKLDEGSRDGWML